MLALEISSRREDASFWWFIAAFIELLFIEAPLVISIVAFAIIVPPTVLASFEILKYCPGVMLAMWIAATIVQHFTKSRISENAMKFCALAFLISIWLAAPQLW